MLRSFPGARSSRPTHGRPALALTILLTLAAAPALAQKPEAGSPDERLAALRAAGKSAAITVLPAGLAGNPSKQVGEVIAMMLERGGMTNLAVSSAEFRPPAGADLAATAKAAGEFVRANPPKTDYVLFADFLGSPKKGVDEVRGVLLDKHGELVWQDRQTPSDADFKRISPNEPMECCILIAERLRPVLALDDPTRSNAPEGKIAQIWRERSGVPDESETKEIERREAEFRKTAKTSTLLVYPPQAGEEWKPDGAATIAKSLIDAGATQATAAKEGPQLAVEGNMNEQKVLWGMARAFKAHVQKNPPDADYAVYSHYIMGNGNVGAVHFAVCDRKGELVIVEFLNSHRSEFRAAKLQQSEDCDRLIAQRLASYCK